MRFWAVCAVSLLGCSSELTLNVDLKTDFVPGIEFVNVEAEVARGGTVVGRGTRRARIGDPFDLGLRVSPFSLPAGTYDVRLRMYDPQGSLLIERPTVVDLDQSFTTLIYVTRDCRGIRCPLAGGDPGLTACFGGRCVPPSCGPDNLEACMVACTNPNTDCGIVPSCVRVRCESGACFREGLEGACAPGQWCNPELGCETMPELPDAGMDFDAGPPACAGACDDGVFCNGTETCTGGVCLSSGNPCSGSQTCNETADRCESGCECTPGQEESGGGCGACGTDRRVCTASCTWGGWSCQGEGACSPGQTEDGGGCGNCGTRRRTCNSDCSWGGYGCVDEGPCSPGQEDWGGSCGACQVERRTCNGGCGWNGWECVTDPGAACTGGRRTVAGSCACWGWEMQEECQSCQWVNIGCQNVSGGAMCGAFCDGDFRCQASRFCECFNGSWSCEGPGSC